MDIDTAKVICIFLLFVDTLLFGWPPYFLVTSKKQNTERCNRMRKKIISYLTCFAGGVFLGACMLHLLPEGLEKMEKYFVMTDAKVHFPVFEAVVAGGFFLIAFVEQLAHKLLHTSAHARTENQNVELVSNHRHGHDIELGSTQQPYNQSKNNFSTTTGGPENGHHQANGLETPVDLCMECDSTTRLDSEIPPHVVRTTHNGGPDHQHKAHDDSASQGELAMALKNTEGNLLRSLMLLTALSFHTVFDGLAVGLTTDASSVWQLFGAICIHKSLVAICLGTELFLAYKQKPLRAFLTIFAFSIITPMGVGLGMLLTSGNVDSEVHTLTSAILEGVATGTFLYVTFFEILRVELAERGGILRLFLVVIGFGAMAAAKLPHSD